MISNLFRYMAIALVVLVLAGCKQDEKDVDIDLSNDNQSYGVASDEQAYGPVVHQGVLADKVAVKTIKTGASSYAYVIYFKSKEGPAQAVSLVCDLRTQGAGFQHTITNHEGYVPKGRDMDISLMNYRAGVLEVREADEGLTPIFSTTSHNNNFIVALRNLNKLDPHSTVAFTIDKEQEDGYSEAIAWSYLIPVDKLITALGTIKTQCENIPLATAEQYIFGIDPQ